MNQKKMPYLKELAIFTFPILCGQLGQMLIGAGDVFVAGRVSASFVAAMAVAHGLFMLAFFLGMGWLLGISPVLSKRRGSGEEHDTYLVPCLLFSLVVSIVTMLMVWGLVPLVPLIGIETELEALVQRFLVWIAWSLPGAFVFMACREFLQAHEDLWPANVVSMIAVVFNVAFAFGFVFGLVGLPELGFNGIALASIVVRCGMAGALVLYARKSLRFDWKNGFKLIKEVMTIGIPTGFAIFVEGGTFAMVTFIVGQFGTVPTAAHNVVLTLASLTFMIPLSVSIALSVKVGHAFGARDLAGIRGLCKAGLFLSLCFMASTTVAFVVAPRFFVGLFVTDSQVIAVGVPILFVAALFQLFDGAQVTLGGALRGLHVARPTFVVQFVAYWVIGIPVGTYLAFVWHQGAVGLWRGLAASLCMAAVCLGGLLLFKLRRLQKVRANS